MTRQGPRRTTLDLVAARCTWVEGGAEAVEHRLQQAACELLAQVEPAGAHLVVIGLEDPEGVALPPRDHARLRRAGSCGEAEGLLADLEGPLAVLVSPAAMADRAGVAKLVARSVDRPATGLLLGGFWPEASERLEAEGFPATSPARTDRERPAPAAPRDGGPARPEAASRVALNEDDPWRPVAVNVLGPVLVTGMAGGLARHPKLCELAVYLTLHEEGAPSRVWSSALWPDRKVPPQTIANRLSELRRLLGFASDGRPRLRREGEWHRLVDVESDWSIFRVLAARGGDPTCWRRALELVRGRPLSGLREVDWARVEGLEGEMERTIADCALRLSAALLEQEDAEEAAWAAQQGLRAVPWDERLHRALMRAGAAAGNRGQVESTLRNLALALDIEGDPLGRVHPETARLYAQLSGRPAPSPGSVPATGGRA